MLGAVAVAVALVPFGLLVLLARADGGPLRGLDRGVTRTLNRQAVEHPDLTRAWQALSDAGGPDSVRDVLAVCLLVLLARRRWRLAAFVAVTGIGISLLTSGVKVAVGRARPLLDLPVSDAPGFAFPSGHASGATVGAGVVVLLLWPRLRPALRPWLLAVGVAYAGLVGVSRVWLGVHWTTDVVGGWLLGLAWLAATTAALVAAGRPRTEPPG